jgi:hypothetical protein
MTIMPRKMEIPMAAAPLLANLLGIHQFVSSKILLRYIRTWPP